MEDDVKPKEKEREPNIERKTAENRNVFWFWIPFQQEKTEKKQEKKKKSQNDK